MPHPIVVLLAVLGLAACTNPNDLDTAPAPLGDFRLGHNIVVAPNPVKGPLSRTATKEEWIASVSAAIDERFGRYDGARLYHLGISIDGYVLARPGVPVVAAPKSILILQVTVWDDAAARKLNETPERFTVVESLSPDTVLGSGHTLTAEEQMQNLSRNAAKRIETWLVEQTREQGWFEGSGPAAAPGPAPKARRTPSAPGSGAPADKEMEENGEGEAERAGAPEPETPADA